jgi:hypothetical protein
MSNFFNKGLLISIGLFVAPFAASAETVFMVQLGAFDSEKKAAAHWQSLVSTFPDLFDKLNYSPSEVVMKPENFVSYRTQAGPIPTRDEAEGICEALIRSGYECGVSETAMFYSGDKEITQSGAPVPASAATPAPAAIAAPSVVAPVVSTPAIIPFAPQSAYVPPKPAQQQPVMGSLPQNLAVQNVPVAAPIANQVQGTIAAEEAIPVPLSTNNPSANPYVERNNNLMNAHPSDDTRVNSFWADISFFSNETAAAQYVKSLKMRDPLLPANLRIRITRPYGVVTGNERLSLRMGPFVTTRPIMRLCMMTRQDNLRCRAVKDMGGSVRNSDRYSTRRGATRASTNYAGYRGSAYGSAKPAGNIYAPQRNATQAPFTQPSQTNRNGSYYVQLGSFLSPNAATAKWSQLQARHSSVLSNVGNDVMAPAQGSVSSRLFRLRAGPFADMNSAYSLCGQLKAQGTLCIVVK